jgi:hypothetical protein
LHGLEEIRRKVEYKCSRCGLVKDQAHRSMLQATEHACQKARKQFSVVAIKTSMEELKTMLKLGPKIDPKQVDDVIREVGWTHQTMVRPFKRRRSGEVAPNLRSVVGRPNPTQVPDSQATSAKRAKTPSAAAGAPPQSSPESKNQQASSPAPSDWDEDPGIELADPLDLPPPESKASTTTPVGRLDTQAPNEAPVMIQTLPPMEAFLQALSNTEKVNQLLPQGLTQEDARVVVTQTIPETAAQTLLPLMEPEGAKPVMTVTTATNLPTTLTAPSFSLPVQGYDPLNPGLDFTGPTWPGESLQSPVTGSTAEPLLSTPLTSFGSGWRSVRSTTSRHPYCRDRLGAIIMPSREAYFESPDGTCYMKVPLIHRATGAYVQVVAPAEDCDKAAILRDCPEFMDYDYHEPDDLIWADKTKHGRPVTMRATILYPSGTDLGDAVL